MKAEYQYKHLKLNDMQEFIQASVQLVCPFLGTVPKQQGSMIAPGNKGSKNQLCTGFLGYVTNIMYVSWIFDDTQNWCSSFRVSNFPILVALPARLEHLTSLFWSRNVVENVLPPNFYSFLNCGSTLCMQESLRLFNFICRMR